eukprot:362365-Chlamydomonas_euryale.AAC.2
MGQTRRRSGFEREREQSSYHLKEIESVRRDRGLMGREGRRPGSGRPGRLRQRFLETGRDTTRRERQALPQRERERIGSGAGASDMTAGVGERAPGRP